MKERGRRLEKAPVAEGDVFLVPLRDRGFARGVLARYHAPLGLGYFFGPRLDTPADAFLDGLVPGQELLLGKFGDLGLLNLEWKVVGAIRRWERARWPLPVFGRLVEDGEQPDALVSWYDDRTLEFVREEPIAREQLARLPQDVTMGYGSVELRLTKLLGSSQTGASRSGR